MKYEYRVKNVAGRWKIQRATFGIWAFPFVRNYGHSSPGTYLWIWNSICVIWFESKDRAVDALSRMLGEYCQEVSIPVDFKRGTP